MVQHTIIWKLKEDLADPAAVKAAIKRELEALEGVVPGLVSMRILTEGFDSSAGDLMMRSRFSSRAALDAYQSHPAHQKAAGTFVRPYAAARLSFDYDE